MKPVREGSVLRRARPALGTLVEIACAATSEAAAREALEAAFQAIESVHRLMSFHDPASDVSRLNEHAHQRPVAIDARTWRVLEIALDLHRQSRGSFDIAIAPHLLEAGLLPRRGDRNDTPGTSADIRLITGHRAGFARPLLIDLGGIAKGFAVDAAIEALHARGIRHAVVNAGGDLRVLGDRAEVVHLRNPAAPRELVRALALARGAIATSAAYFERAVIDAPAGRAYRGNRSASVIAPTATIADALAKVALLRGRRCATLLKRYHAHAVLLASRGGRLEATWLPEIPR